MNGPPIGRGIPLVVVVAAAIGAAVAAPVSPGPLSEPHAALDDPGRCFDCHGRTEGRPGGDAPCLDCHVEIAERVRARAGFHGRSANEACASCHPEHGGRGFDLVEWPGGSREAFDHRRAGWPLAGRHAVLECASCHRPDRLVEIPATRDGPRDPSRTYLGLDPTCTACHTDVHDGKLGADCAACHQAARWSQVPNFDHARTGYPLSGKHAPVDCGKCHLPVEPTADAAAVPSRIPIRDTRCVACHEDSHRGAFGVECAACHVTDGFKIVREDRFDHARTGYPLAGRHATVTCAACHDPERAWGRRPAHARCGDCHRDRHAGTATLRGAPADCAACHDERGFRPATYGVAEHDAAAYRLDGKHRAVPCAACHRPAPRPGRTGTPDPAGVVLRPGHERCGECHDDAHDGQLASTAGGAECSGCHAVAGWKPSTYAADRHATTRLPLGGRHAVAPCAACHGPARAPKLLPLPAGAARGTARVAVALDPACRTCHVDPHGGAFAARADAPGRGCETCHGVDAFRPARIDAAAHDAFDYPLRGAHRTVPCVMCHKGLGMPADEGSTADLRFETRHDACEACHATPHGRQFDDRAGGAACDRCHDVEAFRPAARFDHERDAAFALGGAHANVACSKCHPLAADADGIDRTRFRPVPRTCRECHAGDARIDVSTEGAP